MISELLGRRSSFFILNFSVTQTLSAQLKISHELLIFGFAILQKRKKMSGDVFKL